MDDPERATLSLNKEPANANYARAEITLKLDSLPSKTQVSGKDTSFVVKDAKGHSYKITCKTKTFNKSKKTIEGFKHSYVISCSTKEFTINGKQVEMNQSGMQVFEKVPKPIETEETPEES